MAATFQDALRAQEPSSPYFARVAAEVLARGDADGALALCMVGRREFPRYPAGQLILGKCYHALGRRVEAILEYEHVAQRFPDNVALRQLLDAVRVEEDRAFEAFAARRVPEMTRAKDSLTLAEYGKPLPEVREESGVDFLLKQLQEVKKKARIGEAEDEELTLREAGEGSGRIVTATLAEIYASQKEYGEAIRAYRRLMEDRPAEAERYAQRIRELEELAKSARE